MPCLKIFKKNNFIPGYGESVLINTAVKDNCIFQAEAKENPKQFGYVRI